MVNDRTPGSLADELNAMVALERSGEGFTMEEIAVSVHRLVEIMWMECDGK